MHGEAPMLGDGWRHLRHIDLFGRADHLGGKLRVPVAAAARASIGTMLDDRSGIIAYHPAVTLMTRLGAAGLGLLAPLLAIRRGRLRRGPRGLLRTLQPQHQIDQFRAAQPLKIASAHPTRESAKSGPRTGVSNYRFRSDVSQTGRRIYRMSMKSDTPITNGIITANPMNKGITQEFPVCA